MRIVAIRERTVPLRAEMRNATIAFDEMTASAVAIVTDAVREGKPVIGYGFSSIGRYGHSGLLRERFMPRLMNAAPATLLDEAGANLDPARCWATLMRNEKPGGHGERSGAVGVLDGAIWDIVAKIEEKPLWRVLAERFNGGRADAWVAVYGSGGHYYPQDDIARLAEELARARDLGYRRVKIKIGAAPLAMDLKRIETALAIVGDGDNLAVDGNAAFDAATAHRYCEALAPYRLAWLEEFTDPLDFAGQAALCAAYHGAFGTGENLFALAETRNLLRYAGLRPERDFLQMDIGLAYGLVEYLRMIHVAEEAGWSRRRFLPHAGHLVALHAAAGLGLGGHEAAPDERLPYGGLYDGARIEAGRVRPPDIPGVGFEVKSALYDVLKLLVD